MCKVIEDYGEKQRLEGKTEGKIEGAIEMAKKMIAKKKFDDDEIAEYTGLPKDKVQELMGGKLA